MCNKWFNREMLLVMLAVFLLVLLLGFWRYAVVREAQIAANLTPESVIQAFKDAGFQIDEVQNMDYFPGPMSPGQRGTRFSTETSGEIVHVFVVLYNDNEEAKRVAAAINDLNQQMGGSYGYAFCRGPILLDVAAYDQQVAHKFYAILKAIK